MEVVMEVLGDKNYQMTLKLPSILKEMMELKVIQENHSKRIFQITILIVILNFMQYATVYLTYRYYGINTY